MGALSHDVQHERKYEQSPSRNEGPVIRFELPESAHAHLTIHDVTGKEVARLVDGMLRAGQHRTTLDARHLTSGVYLYRLESKEFTEAKPMLLSR